MTNFSNVRSNTNFFGLFSNTVNPQFSLNIKLPKDQADFVSSERLHFSFNSMQMTKVFSRESASQSN